MADNWPSESSVTLMIDCMIPVYLHGVNRENSQVDLLEGLAGAMWCVEGIFPSLQSHIQPIKNLCYLGLYGKREYGDN